MNVSVSNSPLTRQTGEAKDHQAWNIDARGPWFPTLHGLKIRNITIFYKSEKSSF